METTDEKTEEPPDPQKQEIILHYTRAILHNVFPQDKGLEESLDIAERNGSLFSKVNWYDYLDEKHFNTFSVNASKIAAHRVHQYDAWLFGEFSGISAEEIVSSSLFRRALKGAYIVKYPNKVGHWFYEI